MTKNNVKQMNILFIQLTVLLIFGSVIPYFNNIYMFGIVFWSFLKNRNYKGLIKTKHIEISNIFDTLSNYFISHSLSLILLFLLISPLMLIYPKISEIGIDIPEVMNFNFYLNILISVILEELFFRYYIYNVAEQTFNSRIFILIPIISFAMAHSILPKTISIIPMSFFLTNLRRKTNTIHYSILFHLIYNFSAVIEEIALYTIPITIILGFILFIIKRKHVINTVKYFYNIMKSSEFMSLIKHKTIKVYLASYR